MRASRGEIKIEEILKKAGLKFKEEYTFDDLITTNGRQLRYDFAIFDDDSDDILALIEFQGVQHYESKYGKKALQRQKFNDNLKVEHCKKHNFNLIIIPYWEEQSIDYDYLINKIYCF